MEATEIVEANDTSDIPEMAENESTESAPLITRTIVVKRSAEDIQEENTLLAEKANPLRYEMRELEQKLKNVSQSRS